MLNCEFLYCIFIINGQRKTKNNCKKESILRKERNKKYMTVNKRTKNLSCSSCSVIVVVIVFSANVACGDVSSISWYIMLSVAGAVVVTNDRSIAMYILFEFVGLERAT